MLNDFHDYPFILYIRKFSRGVYFRETSHRRSFVKIKSSRNGEITLSFTDIGKLCYSCIFTSQICLITLFAKEKFSQKFPDLQHMFMVTCGNYWGIENNTGFDTHNDSSHLPTSVC